MRQAAGVVRDDGKVVQGMQKSDSRWHLSRIPSKGQHDVSAIDGHSAAVHHHKAHILTAVHYHTVACQSAVYDHAALVGM